MIKWLPNLCFAAALFSFSLGTFGLFKFPDPYTRLHAVAISDTLGVGLIGFGLSLLSSDWILRTKLVIILFLFWLINPTMTHLVAKAGLLHGTKPVAGTKLRKG